jgi:hypothetical protein
MDLAGLFDDASVGPRRRAVDLRPQHDRRHAPTLRVTLSQMINKT